MMRPLKDKSRFLILTAIVSLLISLYFWLSGYSTLPEGPSRRIGEASMSLVTHGTLQSPAYFEYLDKVRAIAIEGGGAWQDFFSLGAHDEIYPKHSFFSVLLGALFYSLFGGTGFWIAQQLFTLPLFGSIFAIGRQLEERLSLPISLAAIVVLSSVFRAGHNYAYSFDLHGATLIMVGLAMLHRFPLGGAFLMSLSLFVRPSFAMLFPLLLIGIPIDSRRTFTLRIAGMGLACGLFCLSNSLLYGGPFITAYQRLPMFAADGSYHIAAHPIGFSLTELRSDMMAKFFDSEVGLLSGAPILLFWPFILMRAWRTSQFRTLAMHCLVAVASILYFLSYELWDSSQYPNRFFLPAICLTLPAVMATFSSVVRRI